MLVKFAKYSLGAAGSAGTDWVVFSALYLIGIPPMIDLAISRMAGALFSFIINRSWAFNAVKRRTISVQGRRFLLLYAASYSLAMGQFWLFHEKLAIDPFLSKLTTDTICFVFNFAVMNSYVYHARDGVSTLLPQIVRRAGKSPGPHAGGGE